MTKPPSSRSPARTAAAVSLVVHAAAIVGLWMLPGRPQVVPASAAPIEVTLQPSPPASPSFFTELPESRADEKPEKADFLSNVDSRARDDVEGGDESLPRMEGEADAPQVETADAREAGAPEPVAAAAASPPGPPAPTPHDLSPEAASKPPAETEAEEMQDLLRSPTAPTSSPAADAPVSVRSLADLDIRQQAMRNPDGNAAAAGEISLNTTAWEYAPWLQVFRRVVMERWLPPVAYRMGLIDGWVLARIEIAPDGSLLGVQVLDSEVGNPSLTDAVVYALKAPAPFHKLPDGFPEPSLVLTIRFVYPPVRAR